MSSNVTTCEVYLLRTLLEFYSSVVARPASQQVSTADIVACVLAETTSQPIPCRPNEPPTRAALMLLTTLRDAADAFALFDHEFICSPAACSTDSSTVAISSSCMTLGRWRWRRQQPSSPMSRRVKNATFQINEVAAAHFVDMHASNLYILTLLLRQRPFALSLALLCELCRCAAYEINVIANYANAEQGGAGAEPHVEPTPLLFCAITMLAEEGATLVTSLLWLQQELFDGARGDGATTRAASTAYSQLGQRIVYMTVCHVLRQLRPYIFRTCPSSASCREGAGLRTPRAGVLMSTDAALLLQWSQEQVAMFGEFVISALPEVATDAGDTLLVHQQKSFGLALAVLECALCDGYPAGCHDNGVVASLTSEATVLTTTTAISTASEMALEQLPQVRHLLTHVVAQASSNAMPRALVHQAQRFILFAERARTGQLTLAVK